MKRLLILFFVVSPFVALSQEPVVPKLWGTRVHDEAKILSSGSAARLEQQLKMHEDSTSNQIAVLIVKTLIVLPVSQAEAYDGRADAAASVASMSSGVAFSGSVVVASSRFASSSA